MFKAPERSPRMPSFPFAPAGWPVLCLLAILATLPGTTQAQSTLVISSDAPCTLNVNGAAKGQLTADEPKAVEVKPGQQLVLCRGASDARVEARPSVEAGQQIVLDLKLKAKIDAVASGITTRYSAPGDGTVVDSQTDLVWAQQDNGYDIDWNKAQRYCSSLQTAGGGWRLPTMNELEALYDITAKMKTPCGRYSCRAPSQLRLTNIWHWSSERSGSSPAWDRTAWAFVFYSGDRSSFVDNSDGRALCVRRRS
jgi:hypothetical protein